MIDENFTTNIVEIIENEAMVSHRVIAKNTDNLEVSVQNLINKHMAKLELFGKVHFQNEAITNSKNKINEEKTFYLNEPQATLLLTFMRNNEIVIEFKVRLVKEFYRMREEIKSKNHQTIQVQKETLDLDFYTQQSEKFLN